MSDPLHFKGRSVSVTAVLLQDTDITQIDERLSEKIAQVPPDFFTTQPLVADISALQGFHPDAKWLKTLKRIFERHKLGLVGVCGGVVAPAALIAAGLAEVRLSTESKSGKAAPLADKVEESAPIETPPPPPPTPPARKFTPTKVIRQNIRSGQRVMAENCDLIIVGAVSPGAEIYADGNITVHGALRGRAFAGGLENVGAHIYCNELDAELVSIAGLYQDKEQLQSNLVRQNVFISLNPDESMQIVSV